jgi:hypothetical protein
VFEIIDCFVGQYQGPGGREESITGLAGDQCTGRVGHQVRDKALASLEAGGCSDLNCRVMIGL